MKKVLFVVLSVVLLVSSLAACGGSTSGTNEKVSITVDMNVANVQENDPSTYAIVQKFQSANPNITVNLIGEATDEHLKKMQMAAQSDTLPEIFWLLFDPAKQMAKAGNILDLSDFLNKNPDTKARITPSLIEGTKDGNFQFGLPFTSLVTGFWYNKAIFAKYGVAEPTAGTTFDQLTDMIKTFNKNNVVTISQGAKDPFSIWGFLTCLSRYGYSDKINDILSGKEKFNNPDFLNLFTKIDQMRTLGAFPSNVTTMGYYESEQMFLTGGSAMFDAGIWEASKIDEALGSNAGFWWGPTFSDGVGNQKVSMNVNSAPFVVSAKVGKDSAKLNAVYKFLNFYYQRGNRKNHGRQW